MEGVRVVVFGRVQGVGFRVFVHNLAERHGAAGSVWNRTDGAVELEACHSDAAVLEAFVRDLHTGPGRVERLECSPAVLEADEFRIAPTRSAF